jgi:predicted alpha/beta hydrolase
MALAMTETAILALFGVGSGISFCRDRRLALTVTQLSAIVGHVLEQARGSGL